VPLPAGWPERWFKLFLRSVGCHPSTRTSYDSILQLDVNAPNNASQREGEDAPNTNPLKKCFPVLADFSLPSHLKLLKSHHTFGYNNATWPLFSSSTLVLRSLHLGLERGKSKFVPSLDNDFTRRDPRLVAHKQIRAGFLSSRNCSANYWALSKDDQAKAVTEALKAGFTHIDTARGMELEPNLIQTS